MTPSSAAISQSACWKPTRSSNNPPTKKPMPFIAFFEPVNHATQRNSCPLPSAEVALIADLDAVLVTSLAMPAMPCATTTQATDAAALQPGFKRRQHDQAGDLQRLPDGQHARNAETRGEPAAAEIGGDAGRLVQQEQERERERRVAEAEEMQQHQHAQGAVDQGKAPVRGRDDGVVSEHRHHTPACRTILAKSTMRQA